MPIWSTEAEEDLKRNIKWYAEQDPATAWRVYLDVIKRAEALDDQPGIGRRGRKAGTKEFVLKGTPFILVYQVKPEAVTILRVLHGAQSWPDK